MCRIYFYLSKKEDTLVICRPPNCSFEWLSNQTVRSIALPIYVRSGSYSLGDTNVWMETPIGFSIFSAHIYFVIQRQENFLCGGAYMLQMVHSSSDIYLSKLMQGHARAVKLLNEGRLKIMLNENGEIENTENSTESPPRLPAFPPVNTLILFDNLID